MRRKNKNGCGRKIKKILLKRRKNGKFSMGK